MTDDEKTTELPPGTTAADFAKDPSAFTAPAGAKNQALVSSWAQRRVPVQISAVSDGEWTDLFALCSDGAVIWGRSLGRGSHDHLGRRQRRCVARAEYKRRPFPTWTDDDLAAFEQHWPSGTRARLAYALLLYTGQRRSDVIRMGWQHVKDGRLAVVQQKTGARVLIPIHPALSAELHAIPTAQMTFLMTATGAGFASGTAFYNWFTDCARAAGIEGKSPHGMRKACARRLIEAGCTPHQAAPSVLWADNAELRQCRRCGGTGIERCPYPRRYDVARNWDPQCRGCNGKGWLYEVWR